MMSCSNIEMRNDDLCFISQLPDPIIHHILSFLTHKDSAKTCVLSKTWNNLYASRHVMIFHERDFKVHSNAESKMFVMNFINQSLNRRMQIVSNPLERFELHLACGPDEKEVHPDHVKECLNKVLGIGVKTMSLILGYGRRLFGQVFVSQTLVELHVDCYFFMRACKTISLPNLKVLSLSDISLKDKSLKKLVLGCPMVEVLRLVHCHTPQKLQVSAFTRLVELGLCNCKNVQEVEILSKYFQAFSSVGKEVGSNTIKLMGTCERVRKLELNAWLSTELSTFNYLEELTLCGLCVMGRISSQSVKKLVIRSCGSKAEVVEIDCPNLVSLIYETIYRPFNFVTACNPSEFRCELCLLRSIHSSQLNALENLFQSTFCATRNLNVVIALGPLQPIIIVEGWLSEAVMSILQKMEDLEPSPVVSITSHSFHWNGILPPYFPMAARLPVYLVSSQGNQFLKDALEKFLNLHKSRNGRYANLSSLQKSEWSSFPDELQRNHGSQYQIDGIALNFNSQKDKLNMRNIS